MLGKVVKNEFKATWKLFILMYAALLALSVVTRVSLEFKFENKIFEFFQILLTIVYVVLAFGILAITGIMALWRYYTNMHKDQGYLTHTLPVKEWKNIFSKTFVFTVWTIVSFLVSIISVAIFLIGIIDYGDVIEVVSDIFENLFNYPKLILLAVLFIILMIVQVVLNLLAMYSSISVGQSLFKKHKIFGAILAYFVMNYAISTLLNFMMIAMDRVLEGLEIVGIETTSTTIEFAFRNMNANVDYALAVVGVLYLYEIIAIAIYYFVANYMLTKKLNLE